MPETKYGKYIVTDLKTDFSEEFNAQYAKWATRILWIDDKVVEGAFQMNVSWYLKPQTGQQPLGAHTHDSGEIIGFFGNNHEDPHGGRGGVLARGRETYDHQKLPHFCSGRHEALPPYIDAC